MHKIRHYLCHIYNGKRSFFWSVLLVRINR